MSDGLHALMRAQVAAEMELAHKPIVRFNLGHPPPVPGLYLARVEIRHCDDVARCDHKLLYVRRSFEEWDGQRWVHVGFHNGTCRGRVTGWLQIED